MSTTETLEDVVAITVTGDRAQALELCAIWMKRQTKRPGKWMVIDNPGAPYDLGLYRAICRIPAQFTKILIVEDDDYYGPEWVEYCATMLDSYDLVGEAPARMYNFRYPSWRVCYNDKHASLSSTAFRRRLLPHFCDTMDRVSARLLDKNFWLDSVAAGAMAYLGPAKHIVSMKGMPGRAGLGCGHREELDNPDPGFKKLEEWIGDFDLGYYTTLASKLVAGGW